jgi:hypothetical protein
MDVVTLWGTIAMSLSAETESKTAWVVPNSTAEIFCKFLSLISTRVPSGPLVGEMPRISGWAAAESRANRKTAQLASFAGGATSCEPGQTTRILVNNPKSEAKL